MVSPIPPYQGPDAMLPGSLRGAEQGTFAHHSVAVRLGGIGRRVIEENRFTSDVNARLEKLIEEIPDGPIRSLQDAGAPDALDWMVYLSPFLGRSWLQVPWFFAECYFYRRILDICGYFQPGAYQGLDPYRDQKRKGLEGSTQAVAGLCERLSAWRQIENAEERREAWAALLSIDLWGNQADLSMWPVGRENPHEHQEEARKAHLLVDQGRSVVSYLCQLEQKGGRVDFLPDNAGFELICDLALADFLLESQAAGAVHFHLKGHPTFVSDAVIDDVHATLGQLVKSPHEDVQALGKRLQAAARQDRLILEQDLFWNSPLAMWEMPIRLSQALAESDLVISKGDANYRRLLGDRHWSSTLSFEHALRYMRVPLLALRVLKSEVIVGLRPGQGEMMDRKDGRWMVNGQWGLVQFHSAGLK